MNEEKYVIVWILHSNEGEQYDNDERFCGHDTRNTVITETVTRDKLRDRLESIFEIPADYGDGVTNSKLLVVYDEETKTPQDIDGIMREEEEIQNDN